MKQNTKHTIPTFAVLALFGLLLSVGAVAAAYPAFVGVGVTTDDREALENAIANNDYSEWKSIMTAQLTEERFQKLADHHTAMREKHEAVASALEAEDYSAWVEAMSADGREPQILEYVTEDTFGTFVELHEAHESGDMEKVMDLSEELGFPKFIGKQKMRMHRN